MIETVAEHCQHIDCKYRSKGHGLQTCDYILIKHKTRGCDISVCDKYEAGKKKMISTLGGFRYENEDDWW